jgi:aspartate 1-decarboxylase
MAAVTSTDLNYQGSIAIDRDLIDAAGLHPYEMVLVANCNTGARGETYVIEAARGSREIQLNGAMARLAQPGDRLIVLAYAFAEPAEVKEIRPRIVVLDAANKITEAWDG